MQDFSRCSSAVPRSWGQGFINQPVGCIIIARWQIGLYVFFFPLTIGLGQDMQCLLFFFPLEVRAGRRQAMSVSFTLDPWAGPSQIIWKPMNIILNLHISTAFASLFISSYGLIKVHVT